MTPATVCNVFEGVDEDGADYHCGLSWCRQEMRTALAALLCSWGCSGRPK
jgi:hypothetical protein